MIIGFTGTQQGMTQLQRDALPGLLSRLRITGARHGDCIGADAQFHAIVEERFPTAPIYGHPGPDGPKRAHCAFFSHAEPKPYLVRNEDIVNFSDCLVATPKGPEVQRSGTWSTVRLAVSIGRLVIIIWPDGELQPIFETGGQSYGSNFKLPIRRGNARHGTEVLRYDEAKPSITRRADNALQREDDTRGLARHVSGHRLR